MTPECEQELLIDVGVIKESVERIEANMVTHDQCEAKRERDRRQTSNGALTTYRDRTWRLTTIFLAIAGTGAMTGIVTWLLIR